MSGQTARDAGRFRTDAAGIGEPRPVPTRATYNLAGREYEGAGSRCRATAQRVGTAFGCLVTNGHGTPLAVVADRQQPQPSRAITDRFRKLSEHH